MIIISNISLRHQKFVDEMRSVLENNKDQTNIRAPKSTTSSNKNDDEAALRAELERKFDELFGTFFDEND